MHSPSTKSSTIMLGQSCLRVSLTPSNPRFTTCHSPVSKLEGAKDSPQFCVVIDDEYLNVCMFGSGFFSSGRSNSNVAPPIAPGTTVRILPPCISTSSAAAVRPLPMPSGLRVTPSQNTRSRSSGSIPGPYRLVEV